MSGQPLTHFVSVLVHLGGLKPSPANFFMKTLRLHGAHLAMGGGSLKRRYALVQVEAVYDGQVITVSYLDQ